MLAALQLWFKFVFITCAHAAMLMLLAGDSSMDPQFNAGDAVVYGSRW